MHRERLSKALESGQHSSNLQSVRASKKLIEELKAELLKTQCERNNLLQMLQEKDRELTTLLTISKKYTGFSRVYFNKDLAFGSAKDLFFTMGHELVHVSQFAALTGQSSNLFTVDFKDMLDYHAYSFESSLGGVRLNSFSRVEISAWMKAYSQFNSLSPINFPWTYNHSFKYPF